jgi:hypothetical protein
MPEKTVVPKDVPLLESAIPVMAVEGIPEPESIRVRLFTVTAEALGLLKRTWTTSTFVAPGSWVELDGAAGPVVTDRVTWVGVKLGVNVGEWVDVLVVVKVGV